MYYLCSESKGADHMRGFQVTFVRLCFHIYANSRFSYDAVKFCITSAVPCVVDAYDISGEIMREYVLS